MNVGARELSVGLDLLRQYGNSLDAPLVSTNLVMKDKQKPIWKPWVYKEINGLKIAILGVVSPKFLDIESLNAQGVEVVPIVVSLQKILPKIRPQVDLVVLLASTGIIGANSTINQVGSGIDLVLVGRDYYKTFESEQIESTYLFKNGQNGQYLNVIKCYMNQGKLISVNDNLVPLNNSIITTDKDFEPFTIYQREVRDRQKELRIKKDPMLKKIEEYKAMSPYEYMQSLKRNSATSSPK